MPLKTHPFERIAMDLVGPLKKSRRGNRYILTIVDYATRYPEAIALPSTEAERIAKELIKVFSRVGIPEEILTDQGANFIVSTLLQELYVLLHVRRIRTSPYHPQTDGLVERFNGTLKSMLRKFAGRSGKDWDEYLPNLLFAYREVPQESTGVSPFELLYGRTVRGPLDVIREGWTAEEEAPRIATPQILETRKRMEQMREVVMERATSAQKRQKEYYDRRTSTRTLNVGDQVLVLLPNQHNSLKLEWTGPYKILRRVGEVDYEVEMAGRKKEIRVYHINLLKRWCPPSHVFYLQEANMDEENDQDLQFYGQEVTGIGEQGQHLKREERVQLLELRDTVTCLGEYQDGQMLWNTLFTQEITPRFVRSRIESLIPRERC